MSERTRVLEPPELAALVDLAERPRVDDWSLRAALTRYAQPEPQRVSDLLELVRRIEFALPAHMAELERDGAALWDALSRGDSGATDGAVLPGLLAAMAEIDRLGDVLAAWAVDRQGPRPDAEVDAVIADVTQRLDRLGVAREERVPPTARGPRRRG